MSTKDSMFDNGDVVIIRKEYSDWARKRFGTDIRNNHYIVSSTDKSPFFVNIKDQFGNKLTVHESALLFVRKANSIPKNRLGNALVA